jgi:hypothetical protein
MSLDRKIINNLFNDISTMIKQIYISYYNHNEPKNRLLIDALVAVNRMEVYIKEGIDWRGKLDLMEKGLLQSEKEYGFPVFSPIR